MRPLKLLVAAAFCCASVSAGATTPLEDFDNCLNKSGDYTTWARAACVTDRADAELARAVALVRTSAKDYGNFINDEAHPAGWVLNQFNLNQSAWETYMASSCDYLTRDMGTDASEVVWVRCKIKAKQNRTDELLEFHHFMTDV